MIYKNVFNTFVLGNVLAAINPAVQQSYASLSTGSNVPLTMSRVEFTIFSASTTTAAVQGSSSLSTMMTNMYNNVSYSVQTPYTQVQEKYNTPASVYMMKSDQIPGKVVTSNSFPSTQQSGFRQITIANNNHDLIKTIVDNDIIKIT